MEHMLPPAAEPAKGILYPYAHTDNYIDRDYNMNIYKGCSHGCVYCDSRSLCYQLADFDRVRPKADALALLERALKKKRRRGIIATGAMSDPYTPLEERLQLTRGALALIAQYGFSVSITTKSPLVARDAPLLADIAKSGLSDVRLSITTLDDDLCAKIEPGTAPASARFAALETLSRAGVFTGVFITPVLPYLTDQVKNITGIVQRAADCGATNVVCMPGMTLRAGNREYYYQALDRYFPGLKARYMQAFGNAYVCASPQAGALWAAFEDACRQRGLLYTFPAINSAMRALEKKQLSLFD